MKLLLLVLIFCFGSLNAQSVDLNDPNLKIGMAANYEGDFVDPTGIHQNAQRSYGTVPAADCPECAFAQQIRAHELYAIENGGTGDNISGSGSRSETEEAQK